MVLARRFRNLHLWLMALLLAALLLPLTLSARPRQDRPVVSYPLRIYSVRPGLNYLYQQLPSSYVYRFPLTDFKALSKITFRSRSLPMVGALAISTAFLVNRDETILHDAKQLGDRWGIKHTEQQARLADWRFRFAGRTIDASIHVPHDLETGMYYLGDGVLHSVIGAGLWSYGTLRHDERAAQTGAQCLEVMVCTCFATQALKHVCGRESPMVSTEPRGHWQLLPNPVVYANHPSRFDGMPSGHVATAMGTVTVLADNYPEQTWIRPVGYSLIGVLMYAMLNNGVHWASDYPVGIAVGYTMAKIVDSRSRTLLTAPTEESGLIQSAQLLPYAGPDGAGLTWNVTFK
jgi:membrane-associated phospholipid phosphatase